MNLQLLASHFCVTSITGRYVTNEHIIPFLQSLPDDFQINEIGKSVLGKSVFSVSVGTGKKKVLAWSQMHGNESTTTKGLLDFLNFLQTDDEASRKIKSEYTLFLIPILNPDGAERYTRVNANEIDLNRDAKAITQPESQILRRIYEEFQPDLCLNLHDQRTIFGTEHHNQPASMSFLAPAYNDNREYNIHRVEAVSRINTIYKVLSGYIPTQIGRFDDSFNDNCIGDYLMTRGTPVVLFEAGHYADDYQRDTVRKFVFIALYSVLNEPSENETETDIIVKYLQIPQNKICFFDFIYKNITVEVENNNQKISFAIQFSEVLEGNKIIFVPKVAQINDLDNFFGHKVLDGSVEHIRLSYYPEIGESLKFS